MSDHSTNTQKVIRPLNIGINQASCAPRKYGFSSEDGVSNIFNVSQNFASLTMLEEEFDKTEKSQPRLFHPMAPPMHGGAWILPLPRFDQRLIKEERRPMYSGYVPNHMHLKVPQSQEESFEASVWRSGSMKRDESNKSLPSRISPAHGVIGNQVRNSRGIGAFHRQPVFEKYNNGKGNILNKAQGTQKSTRGTGVFHPRMVEKEPIVKQEKNGKDKQLKKDEGSDGMKTQREGHEELPPGIFLPEEWPY